MQLETWTRFADLAVPWALTYALHSSVLLALAWLGARLLRGRSPATEERLWRVALLAGVLTASLQILRPVEPPAPPAVPRASAEMRPTKALPSASPFKPRVASPDATHSPPLRLEPRVEVPAVASRALALPGAWARALGLLWVAVGLTSIFAFAVRWLAFRRRLRDRVEISEGKLKAHLRGLSAKAGLARPVRLTTSEALSVPFARGVLAPEVCLPGRALAELPPHQQEAVLAHEVAHLARLDPLWVLMLRAFGALLFFQPLNRLAIRRLGELSEMAADEWAARSTGRGRDLAACLASVASWVVEGRTGGPVPALARRRSPLGKRIERLLEGGGVVEARWTLRGGTWVAVAALAAVLAGLPGLSISAAGSPPPAPRTPPPPPAPVQAPMPVATPVPATPPAPPAPTAMAVPAVTPAPTPVRTPRPPAAAAPVLAPASDSLGQLAPLPSIPEAPPAQPLPAPVAVPAPAPLAIPLADLDVPRPDGISDQEWRSMQRELRRAREQMQMDLERMQEELAEQRAHALEGRERALEEAQRSVEAALAEADRQALEQAIEGGIEGALAPLEHEALQEEAARKAMVDAERMMSRERLQLQAEVERVQAELMRMHQELDLKAKALAEAKQELERLRWLVNQEKQKAEPRRAPETPAPPR